MEIFWKTAAAAVTAAVLIAVLRKTDGASALTVSLGACVILAAAATIPLRSLRETLDMLTDASGLRSETVSAVMKVCAVGLVTQFCEAYCRESGSFALGKIVEICGSIAALCASAPLLSSVLTVLKELLER
ncbi:MAG: stage III sporulation AC/AD family protein [Oscillospiraceae bacterium]|nr:stage III sporulation AC/AD family protein [Oscillospiraceae bacterium]